MKVLSKLTINVEKRISRNAHERRYRHTTKIASMPLIMFRKRQSVVIATSESAIIVSKLRRFDLTPGTLFLST